MTKTELINALAEYFGVDTDTESYDWNSGCSMGNSSGVWLTLANVVEALEDYLVD